MKLLLQSFTFVFSITISVSWINHLILDPGGAYQVWWSLSEEKIIFRIQVATVGWVGFGISPTEEPVDGDFITAWFKDDKVLFHDRHIDGKGSLLVDVHQDWELLEHWRNETHISLKFQRNLITCDQNDVPITEDTMRLMYAYDDTNPQFHEEMPYHKASKRGMRSILLLQQHLKVSNEVSLLWDVKSPNVTVKYDTSPVYFCSVHKAPRLDRKHHITGFDAVIQPGHETYIHHIILSACVGVTDEEMEPYINTGIRCIEDSMSWKFEKCQNLLFAWTIDQQETVYPEHIGFPLGDSRWSYFVLDVHYDNISLGTEFLDASGLRLKYTSELRQHDVASLIVSTAMNPCVVVPPKQKEFTVVAHGSSECLSPALPPEGVTIYSVKLHSHLTGRKLILRHFRDGKELPPLAKDNNFDFYYQKVRIVKDEIRVLPGDHLAMECVFDTSERNVTTLGGLLSTDEMCLAVIWYYPIIAHSIILSSPTCSLVAGLTGASVNTELPTWIISPVTGQNETFVHYLSTYRWSPLQIPSVQEAVLYSPHNSICVSDNGTVIRGWIQTIQSYKKNSESTLVLFVDNLHYASFACHGLCGLEVQLGNGASQNIYLPTYQGKVPSAARM